MPTVYRFSPPLLVRLLGSLLALLGVALFVVAVVVLVLDLPVLVLTVAVVVTVLVVVVAGAVLSQAAVLVRFDDDGYRIRLLRGAGVRQARWRDVEDAVTATVSGHDVVVLRLRDGRTTSIPVTVLDASPSDFLADLSAHLDTGHGYRRIS